jgi:ABC-type Fe3+-siderophore transport system permease subunit
MAEEHDVLGPLPRLHRTLVAICAIALFVAGGAWVTFTLTGPLLTSVGAGIGAGIGAVVVLLLLHQRQPRRLRAQHVRGRHDRRP